MDTGIIKNKIEEFFGKIGLGVITEKIDKRDGTIFVKLKTDDPKILIGQNGQTLMEIQHLLKVLLRKDRENDFYLDVDINGYKEKKNEYLRELAKSSADEASLAREAKVLPPMPAYDRRIIHLELAERSDIESESVGEEPERRVVIKPKIS